MSKRRLTDRLRARRIRRAMKAPKTRADGPPGDPTFWQSSWLKSLMGGGSLDPFKDSPWVHRAILTICDSLAAVPFRLYTGAEDDPTPVLSGPWVDFFEDPSTRMTASEFWNMTWKYTQMGTGDAFWLLFGRTELVDEREIPVEGQVLSGSRFEEKVINGRLDHWMLDTGDKKVPVELHQVVQFAPIRDPDNPDRGVSPMNAAIRDIRTDDQAARFNEAILKNGARPDGAFSTDQSITLDQAKTFKASWNDLHQGADKAGKIGIFGNGMKWQDITRTHQEMGFQANREWARIVVSAALGVPLMFLMVLDDLHKETSRQVRKQLWEQNLLPKAKLAESLLWTRLFRNRDGGKVWGKFDLSGIEALSEEASTRRDNAAKDRALGIPLNDIITRHELGYEDQGVSGKVGLVPFNLQTVDSAAATFDEGEDTPPVSPSPPATQNPSEDEEGAEDEEERAASTMRRSSDRQAMWERYVRNIQRPGEKKMRTRYLGWARGRIADVMKWLSKTYERTAQRQLRDDEIDAFVEDQHERWHDLLRKQTKPVDTGIIAGSLDAMSEMLGGLESISMGNPRITELIAFRGAEKIKIVDTFLKKRIRNTLVEGTANGDTLAEMQERVRAVAKVQAHQAQTIARTESASAASQADEEVMEAEGIERVEWLSSGDGAERPTTDDVVGHAELDGNIVKRGDEFKNGLRYPHDPDATNPGDVINCRCKALPVIE